jgi:hypothetical protein
MFCLESTLSSVRRDLTEQGPQNSFLDSELRAREMQLEDARRQQREMDDALAASLNTVEHLKEQERRRQLKDT